MAISRFSKHAAADGYGAWIVTACPARLFGRSHAITAPTVAELLAAGYADNDPHAIAFEQSQVAVFDVLGRPWR